MEIHFYKFVFGRKSRVRLFVLLTMVILSIIYYSNNIKTAPITLHVKAEKTTVPEITNLYKGLDLIDLQRESKENFTCIKTKYLFQTFRTTICIHDNRERLVILLRKTKYGKHDILLNYLKFFLSIFR